MAMRELLLVRKLEEEENAKNKPTGDNISQITPQPHNDASAHLNECLPNTSLSNSSNTNQEDSLVSSKPVDEELQLSPVDTDHHTSVLEPDVHHKLDLDSRDPLLVENNSTNVVLETTQDSTPTITGDNTQPPKGTFSCEDVTPELSEEKRKEKEAHAQALLTRRESLKDFFIKKQSYINKDTLDTITFPSENINENEEMAAVQSVTDDLKKGENTLIQKQHDERSQDTTGNSNTSDISEPKSSIDTQPTTDLSLDEKRQKAAATRAAQRKGLKEMMRQKKVQQAQNKSEEGIDIVISAPERTTSRDAQVTNENNDNNDDDNKQSDTPVIKKSVKGQNQTDLDIDSDSSLDWDALIAQASDLESGAMIRDFDVDDNDEDFWKLEKIDTTELAKHLSPSSTPPAHGALDLQSAVSHLTSKDDELSDTPLEVDTEEVEDIWSLANASTYDLSTKEEDDFDRTLDAQLTPMLKPTTPVSPALSPSPNSSLSGGKIPRSAQFGFSPLSPTSSRASSVADPDEYETMSNGSHTSVLSTGSTKSSVIRRPSTTFGIRPPSRSTYSSISSKIASPQIRNSTSPTPNRPRSLSVISNSSAEESTTSSVGTTTPSRIASPTRMLRMSPIHPTLNSGISPPGPRQRSLSSVSNSSTDERMVKTSNSTTPATRLSRIGYATNKPSGIRPTSPVRTRNVVQSGASPNSVASKLNNQTRSSQLQRSTSVASGLARPSSRVGTTNTKTSMTGVPARQSLTPLSETTSKTSLLSKKARSQSISDKSGSATNPSGIVSPTELNRVGNRSSTILRKSGDSSIKYNGGRQSSDSLSSHEDYSAVNSIFTPPESPTNTSSETDSLTSVSYGSSPGRGTSPIPPATRLVPPITRSPSVASKLPPSRLSKYTPGPPKSSTGLRKSRKD